MRAIQRRSCNSAILVLAFVAWDTQAATFSGLGDFSDGDFQSGAVGVSADGTVVVGWGSTVTNGQKHQGAFRWTQPSGLTYLGDLPGGPTYSVAYGVSADGTAVAGDSQGPSDFRAYRWDADGMLELPFLLDAVPFSESTAISGDGKFVVGWTLSQLGERIAVRWTPSGVEAIGDLPGGRNFSWAESVSADGSVVVGEGTSVDGIEAFRWSETEGITGLGDLPGGRFNSGALDVSADGNIVVGLSYVDNDTYEAFRWTKETGMVGLGDLAGGIFQSQATAVSGDGQTIVGVSDRGGADGAMVWTQALGMRSLRDVLIDDFGLASSLKGWTLSIALDVSHDGSVIVGYGLNPNGDLEAWRAVLTPVPEPATLLTALIGLAALVIVAAKRHLR